MIFTDGVVTLGLPDHALETTDPLPAKHLRVSRPALLENPESESPSVCRLLKKLPSELLSDNSADSVFCVTHLTMFEHPTGHYTQLHHIGVDLTRGYFET